jgi:hypothetical protein
MVRSQLKRLIEEALLAEQDPYLDLGCYEHAPVSRLDFRNGFYFRDLVTKLGVLCRSRVPRTRKGFRSQFLPRYQRRQQAVNNLGPGKSRTQGTPPRACRESAGPVRTVPTFSLPTAPLPAAVP